MCFQLASPHRAGAVIVIVHVFDFKFLQDLVDLKVIVCAAYQHRSEVAGIFDRDPVTVFAFKGFQLPFVIAQVNEAGVEVNRGVA